MKKLLLSLLVALSLGAISQPVLYYSDPALGTVNDVLKANDGTLYFATMQGLFQVQPGSSTLTQVNTFPSYSLYETDSAIWLGAVGSILKYDGTNWVTLVSTPGLPQGNFQVQQFCATANGTLYVLIDNNVFSYNGLVFSNANQSGNSITAIGNTVYVSTITIQEVGFFNDGLGWNALPSFPPASFAAAHRSYKFLVKDGVLYNDAAGGIYALSNNQWSTVITTNSASSGRLAATSKDLFILNSNAGSGNTIFKLGNVVDTLAYDFHPNRSFDLFKGFDNSVFIASSDRVNRVLEWFPNLAESSHQYGTIAPNDFSATYLASGEMGMTDRSFQLTTVNDVGVIFHQNLWLSANNQVISSGSYRQNGADYFSGPVSNAYDSTYLHRYNHVWRVTAMEIEDHKQNYNKFTYNAPHGIAMWPGNGRVSKGEAQFLAPFVDLNYNGIYEPHLGEYPDIRGTEMLYTISNTHRGPNSASLTPAEPIEIHSMVYGFDSLEVPESQKSLFVSLRIFNRGTTPFFDARMGLFTDFDLGDPMDDLVGTDSIQELFYVYNANLFDAGPIGFGNNPPAVIGAVLNHPLEGVSGFVNMPGGAIGSPSNATATMNYLNAKWGDGSPIRIENPSGPMNPNNGVGHDPNGSDPTTQWLYNEAANWYHNPQSFGDWRLVPIVKGGDLAPDESFCLDLIFVYGSDTVNPTNDELSPLQVAKANLQIMRQFYNDLNYDCLGIALHTDENLPQLQTVALYPNPVARGSSLALSGVQNITRIDLHSILGTSVSCEFYANGNSTTIAIPSSLAVGVYVIHVTSADGSVITRKIVVQ
ncbi:MAG: T9SS type A sorting domain-containing protein [Schleiferiaceae bacterium]|nr:T9SS type A sorting domain-containing protein [Schleiferiaceae bacterium]